MEEQSGLEHSSHSIQMKTSLMSLHLDGFLINQHIVLNTIVVIFGSSEEVWLDTIPEEIVEDLFNNVD